MTTWPVLAARTPSPYPPPAGGGGTRFFLSSRSDLNGAPTLSFFPAPFLSPLPSREGARGRGFGPPNRPQP